MKVSVSDGHLSGGGICDGVPPHHIHCPRVFDLCLCLLFANGYNLSESVMQACPPCLSFPCDGLACWDGVQIHRDLGLDKRS